MIQCYEENYFVLDGGKTVVPAREHPEWDKEAGKKQTIAHQIITTHNTSGDDANLRLKFDAIGVYDNTYVGIMQTAVASGLTKFPVPTVFTNCHNCLAAVGGTINSDVHKYAETICKKIWRDFRTAPRSGDPFLYAGNDRQRWQHGHRVGFSYPLWQPGMPGYR